MKYPETPCACGCGERFTPKRKDQKYFSTPCREKAKNQKTVAIRVPVDQCQRIKILIAARRSGVHRLSKPKHPLLPGIRLAALWLKNQLAEQNEIQGQSEGSSTGEFTSPNTDDSGGLKTPIKESVESANYTDDPRKVFGGAA